MLPSRFHFVILILPTRPVRVELLGAQVHGDDVLGGSGDFLLQALYNRISISLSYSDKDPKNRMSIKKVIRTSFSKTQLFSFISCARHSQSLWLLFSRHSQ